MMEEQTMMKPPVKTVHSYEDMKAASPAQRVVMLYDELIAALQNGIDAIEEHDIEGRWQAVSRACDILSHLCLTLDVQRGEKVAENLRWIYGHILGRLTHVHIDNSTGPLAEAICLLEPLRSAWRELGARNQNAGIGKVAITPQLAIASICGDTNALALNRRAKG
jgi:flagellar protein FliS